MKKFSIFMLVIMLLSACYKDINLYENNYQSRPGFNSFFYTDSVFRIYVFTSAPPGSFSVANIVKNATVTVYEDGQVLDQAVYQPLTDSIGYYVTTATARNGHVYSVKVTYEGKTISAEDSLPTAASFVVNNLEVEDKWSYYSEPDSLYNVGLTLFLDLTINNSTDKGYYMVTGYVNGLDVEYPDTVLHPVRSWINFYSTTTDFPIEQNQYSIINLPFDMNGQGVLLDPAFLTENKVNLKLNFSTSYLSRDSASVNFHVLVMKMSENMYEFFQSYQLYWRSLDNPFVEPVNVRVNVDGGLGIFAGMSIAEDSVKVRF